MPLVFYDTRRRRKAAFSSLKDGEVRLYTCGPTVYAPAHIGNFRTYIFEDLLRRTLKYLGYNVYQVMNLTDIDDKTIRAARERRVSLDEITRPVIDRFFQDLDSLGIERAEVYPRATEHIAEMTALIERLLADGYAYISDGSVYFRIDRFSDYGGLSGMKREGLARGVRIDADEYEKDDFRDFALWKGWTPDDGEVYWDAPFGRGRPGWHIECSAMSMKYLGEEFDIHTGGVDNIFPHHENEIAQSVCATGKGFARWWLHSAHLIINDEKMSKSLGNMLNLDALLNRGYSARALRYTLISAHYRQQLNLTDEVLQASASALERLDTLRLLAERASLPGEVRSELTEAIVKAESAFRAGLEDDLNIAPALAALFEFVSETHRLNRANSLTQAEGNAILAFWRRTDAVLGVLLPSDEAIPADVILMAQQRRQARRKRQWEEADRIRDELALRGYQLEDAKSETIVIGPGGRCVVNDSN